MKNEKIIEVLNNKKNYRFYEVKNHFECGMLLTGLVVKKILNHKISLTSSYGWIKKNEIWLRGLDTRDIKLLLNKHEIQKIISIVKEKQYLIIPHSIYLKNHRLKVNLMIVKRIKHTSIEKKQRILRKDEKKIKKFY